MSTETTDTTAPSPEVPEAAPPPEPQAAWDWRPYGRPGEEPAASVRADSWPEGQGKLTLVAVTARGATFAVQDRARQVEEQARSEVMTLLGATDEFRRLADLRPQFRAARSADSDAQEKLAAAQRRQEVLGKVTPPPPGLASRLVQAQSAVEQLAEEARQKAAELRAIEPLYLAAQKALQARVETLCQETHRAVQEAIRTALLDGLRAFFEAHGEELTELYLARRSLAWVLAPSAADVARAVLQDASEG